MYSIFDRLSHLSAPAAWTLFLVENVFLTISILFLGSLFGNYPYRRCEWLICGITNILNTIVTYVGFWLWKDHLIQIKPDLSWFILPDFLLLFFAMDLLMYLFHYLIHKTFLYKAVHLLHHEAVDPKPIDLFILHPVETFSFGALWLILLVSYPFNGYAIALYLLINILFGLMGHLGREPLPEKVRRLPVLRYLGTSTFHHDHHKDVNHNFGFYTTIWDRLFGTLRQ